MNLSEQSKVVYYEVGLGRKDGKVVVAAMELEKINLRS
jgi:hypothetical protein